MRFRIAIVLLVLGLMGIASMLLSEIPLNFLPQEAVQKIPEDLLPFLLLINPTLLLIITVAIGSFCYHRVGFKAPLLEGLLGLEDPSALKPLLRSGIIGGGIAGIGILLIQFLFAPYLPEAYHTLSETMQLHPITRFLYGGITEEIMIRFGVMSALVWFLSLLKEAVQSWMIWVAIILSSILFALGHLPILQLTIPEPNTALYAFVILGNLSAGLIFGWLYWKRGLESAMIAHVMAHVLMLVVGL